MKECRQTKMILAKFAPNMTFLLPEIEQHFLAFMSEVSDELTFCKHDGKT